MTKTMEPALESALYIYQEVEIDAPPALVFESLLEQLGPMGDMPDGKPMPMTLEAWPGGRWFRDLGNHTGHLWGHVQVIKPPTLLEITGPLFMSYPAISHVQYRITEKGTGSHLAFTHRAMGDIAPDHRKGVSMGWNHILGQIKSRSQSKKR